MSHRSSVVSGQNHHLPVRNRSTNKRHHTLDAKYVFDSEMCIRFRQFTNAQAITHERMGTPRTVTNATPSNWCHTYTYRHRSFSVIERAVWALVNSAMIRLPVRVLQLRPTKRMRYSGPAAYPSTRDPLCGIYHRLLNLFISSRCIKVKNLQRLLFSLQGGDKRRNSYKIKDTSLLH